MTSTRRTAKDTATTKPVQVSAELKALMRRLKLGQLLNTLPERLALAATNHLPHHDFLKLLLTDEVTRRDRDSATLTQRDSAFSLAQSGAVGGMGWRAVSYGRWLVGFRQRRSGS
jgi:hypothetical protein